MLTNAIKLQKKETAYVLRMGLEEFRDCRYNVIIIEICGMGKLMEKELRKRQILLSEAGVGVILFAVWRVVSVNLYLGFGELPLEIVYEVATEYGFNENFFLFFMVAVIVISQIWQLSIRLYIGLSATAEGKGKNKNCVYLVVAAMLVIGDFQFFWEALGLDRMLVGEALEIGASIGIFAELASIYVLLELLISGVCVKLLRKKMKE